MPNITVVSATTDKVPSETRSCRPPASSGEEVWADGFTSRVRMICSSGASEGEFPAKAEAASVPERGEASLPPPSVAREAQAP